MSTKRIKTDEEIDQEFSQALQKLVLRYQREKITNAVRRGMWHARQAQKEYEEKTRNKADQN
jgi:hypothetical protein